MAERKLNINAPLMSVRRSSATPPSIAEAKRRVLEKIHALPNHKPDCSLDQVTEPVAVPFNWEHIPGRRKGNGGSQPQPTVEASIPSSPRLPPGKSTKSGELPLRKECIVANKFSSSNKSNSFTGAMVKLDCDKERIEEKRVSNVNDVDDDVYSDALDRLSHTESFSMNCSISGVSGLDTLDAKNSGTFSTDQQTRDFMMSRFLPAAKAMTLQPSQYASKKQSVAVVEQPREVKPLVRDEKKPLVLKHVSDIIPHFGQSPDEEESEDEVEDYNDSTNNLAKGCGVFSQLRLKNSLCLLNPLPGMKMRNQLPLSSTYETGKPNKSSKIRSYSPVPAVKKAWDAISKNKSSSRAASPERPELRRKWTSESNRFTFSGELQQPGRLSPFRRARAAAGVSPCRSKPQSPLREVRLPGSSTEAENNQASTLIIQRIGQAKSGELPPQAVKKNINSTNPTIEKTLYIDTASTVKLSSNSSFVGITRKIDTVVDELDKRKGAENRSTIEASVDTKHTEAVRKKNMLDSEVIRSLDANSTTLSGILRLRTKEDKAEKLHTEAVRKKNMLDSEVIRSLDANSTTLSGILRTKEDKAEKLVTHQETNGELISSKHVQELEDTDSISNTNNLQIVLVDDSRNAGSGPLPPPLPKSPTESWLWHALPKVSLRNSNKRAQTPTKRGDSNTASSNSKWETIVKTSNLHHDHVRYSQELTTHVSQHSKSKR